MRYETIKPANAVGLDAKAANLLEVAAEACGIPKQRLASAIIEDVLTNIICEALTERED